MPLKTNALYYGGDYNPEQWDRQTIEQDIPLMREAGVNMATVNVFAWGELEADEGCWDEEAFSRLAERIDALGKAGISVDLATGTAAPPAWMAHKYPDSLPVDRQGVRLGFGSRQGYCLSSPEYRAGVVRLSREIATRFGSHEAVALFHINNEYGCHIHECFCECCAGEFRQWLQQKYGSIEELNHAWGCAFWSQRRRNFEQVEPPRATPTFHNPAHLADWRRFSNEQMLKLFRLEKEQLQARAPQIPITTNFMGYFPPVDYRQWAREVDVVSNDEYPDPADPAAIAEQAWSADMQRGYKGQPWLIMEQAPGVVQWRAANASKRPGQWALWSLSQIARGADGALCFQWRQSEAGAETWHGAMVPHYGTAGSHWKEMVDLGTKLANLSPVAGTQVQAEVAVMVDWESEIIRSTSIGPVPHSWMGQARVWHRSLFEAGITADVVGVDADLSQYRMVIVADLAAPDAILGKKLEEFVEGGGQLIGTTGTGRFTPEGKAALGGYLGVLSSLFGVNVEGTVYGVNAAETAVVAEGVNEHLGGSTPQGAPDGNPDPRVCRITAAVGAPAAARYVGIEPVDPALERAMDSLCEVRPALRGKTRADSIEVEDATPIAFFTDGIATDLNGKAAITRRKVGKGQAWYVGTDLDLAGRAGVLALVGAHARVRPVLPGAPAGVEAVKRGKVLFVLNHADKAAELSGMVGTDLLSATQLSGHVVVPPRSAIALWQ
ncbi:beta-galactosidase [Winkia sp. UMB10116]|uniref:beta-galactosidase n=1 Tax=Winkia sp. UMB10116 TaxID=3046355 RepID=UPI0025577A3D|nr:beta-galactosidase [Winkia sp. UMB10116]MDK6240019.1 beta-galactosidase [Winkia sp. UMB10116]